MAQATTLSKPLNITVWALSILLGLAFLASGLGTIAGAMDAVLNGQLGVPMWALPIIGAIKVVAAIAIVVPVSRFYGAAVLVGTMAGAVVTHLLAADFTGFVAPLVLGILAGIVAWLSRPEWVRLLLQRVRGVPA